MNILHDARGVLLFAGLVVVVGAFATYHRSQSVPTTAPEPSRATVAAAWFGVPSSVEGPSEPFGTADAIGAQSDAASAAPTPSQASGAAVQKVDITNITASLPIRATATTVLNLRAGPGSQFDVVGVISANGSLTVTGCIEASRWCRVDAGRLHGWAYSEYLATNVAGARLIVGDQRTALGIPVVTFSSPVSGSARSN
jgi:uncharacterized protein YraI